MFLHEHVGKGFSSQKYESSGRPTAPDDSCLLAARALAAAAFAALDWA